MNSLELVGHLNRQGTLTKEAALGVLRARERLIKQALASEATRLWANVFALTKEASIFDSLGRGSKTVANESLFGKLRHGGLTPAKDPSTSASWSDVGANLLKMMGIAGLSAGATAGAGALLRHRKDRQLQARITQSYNQMFDEFEDLKRMDPERVQRHFGVLAQYAPSLAADPTVAGSFVQDTGTMGIIQPAMIKALAETQHRIDEMHEGRSPFSQHFDRGLNMAQKAMSPSSRDKSS